MIREEAQGPFTSPGFGLSGNPQIRGIAQTIVGGPGVAASGTGTVRVAGGWAVITASGTITFPDGAGVERIRHRHSDPNGSSPTRGKEERSCKAPIESRESPQCEAQLP